MNQEPSLYEEAREADLYEEADRYQEWLDEQLLKEHQDHPEHFHQYTNQPTMLSKVHVLTEKITNALGPLFHEQSHYPTILDAMCLTMARVIQSSPDKGKEFDLLDKAHLQIARCLEEFLKLEQQIEAKQEARQNQLDKGVDAFAEFALQRINGERVEPGSAGDYPDNCDQPVAKTVQPFTPQQGLIAINGGMGAEARDEAEKAQAEEAEQAWIDTLKEPEEPA